jgi:hypothetical protein
MSAKQSALSARRGVGEAREKIYRERQIADKNDILVKRET